MSLGASPAGVEPGNEAEAGRRIREMFGRIAPRYDLLNHVLVDAHRRALAQGAGAARSRVSAAVPRPAGWMSAAAPAIC